jgi:hypothetical protein
MASILGALLLALTAGATFAALAAPLMSIWQTIIEYIRGIYGTRSTSTRKDPS